ncbi:MAG: hypothetical protein HYW45_04275 [Candidatus Daviesbacteria bacterium]|nr:MAG: hypothetical protein HYW45_04275 [Candidatus Daviesbacteria bacterium]
MSERKDRSIGQFFQEALPAVKDVLLEPIRFSQALKDRLTDVTKIPDYENLSRATKAAIQVRGYMWGYLPIEMPIAMASGLVMQGNVVSGLLVGGGAYLFMGAALKGMNIREQS